MISELCFYNDVNFPFIRDNFSFVGDSILSEKWMVIAGVLSSSVNPAYIACAFLVSI